MDHQAEARLAGHSKIEGHLGLQASVSMNIVVPVTAGFGPPTPAPLPPNRVVKVDISKVSVQKKS